MAITPRADAIVFIVFGVRCMPFLHSRLPSFAASVVATTWTLDDHAGAKQQ
jgi:hypothetical protein